MNWNRARTFNLDVENGDKISLKYIASTTGTTQEIIGEITDYGGMTEFTEITENETGDIYRMYGSGLSNRDMGEILHNGRKVGEFDSASLS